MMALRDTLLCVVFAAALPMGQIMFKWAALYNERLDGPLILRLIKNLPLIGAFSWYGLTALLWFYILTRVPLSQAYVFSILGSALVPLLAWALFKEPMSWRFALGYALMLAGFVVVMQAQGKACALTLRSGPQPGPPPRRSRQSAAHRAGRQHGAGRRGGLDQGPAPHSPRVAGSLRTSTATGQASWTPARDSSAPEAPTAATGQG